MSLAGVQPKVNLGSFELIFSYDDSEKEGERNCTFAVRLFRSISVKSKRVGDMQPDFLMRKNI
jgi:hypothetical protein